MNAKSVKSTRHQNTEYEWEYEYGFYYTTKTSFRTNLLRMMREMSDGAYIRFLLRNRKYELVESTATWLDHQPSKDRSRLEKYFSTGIFEEDGKSDDREFRDDQGYMFRDILILEDEEKKRFDNYFSTGILEKPGKVNKFQSDQKHTKSAKTVSTSPSSYTESNSCSNISHTKSRSQSGTSISAHCYTITININIHIYVHQV